MVKSPLNFILKNHRVKSLVERGSKYVPPLEMLYKEKKLITYLFGNEMCFLAELLLTFMLTEMAHFWYMASYGLSLLLGLVFMFLYHKYITFSMHETSHKNFFLFSAIMLSTFVINWILVYLITSWLPFLHYIIVIILVSIPTSVMSYKINKRIVFKIRWQDELFEDL